MRFEEMTELMRSMWWGSLQVEYRAVDSIPRKSRRAKLAAYVQELPQHSLPARARMLTGMRNAV
jgi:hypothetical protein